jgi:uncharacterized protein YfcZ (UPF0381/DUF406 family)
MKPSPKPLRNREDLSPLVLALAAQLRPEPLPPELGEVAEAIRAETDPLAIGRLLRKAKSLTPHGRWTDWLTANVSLPRYVVVECMRLAKLRPFTAENEKQAEKMAEVIRKAADVKRRAAEIKPEVMAVIEAMRAAPQIDAVVATNGQANGVAYEPQVQKMRR